MNLRNKQKGAGTTNHRNDESLFPRRVFTASGLAVCWTGVLSIFCLLKTILSDRAGVCNLYFRFYQVIMYACNDVNIPLFRASEISG